MKRLISLFAAGTMALTALSAHAIGTGAQVPSSSSSVSSAASSVDVNAQYEKRAEATRKDQLKKLPAPGTIPTGNSDRKTRMLLNNLKNNEPTRVVRARRLSNAVNSDDTVKENVMPMSGMSRRFNITPAQATAARRATGKGFVNPAKK